MPRHQGWNYLHSLCRIGMEYYLLNMYLNATVSHINLDKIPPCFVVLDDNNNNDDDDDDDDDDDEYDDNN